MANETAYLISLIAAVVHGADAKRDDSADLSLLFRIAKYHNVANIACYALEKLYGKEELKEFLSEKHKALFKAAVYENELESISKACEKNGISYLPLKGSVMKYLYPSIDMRTSVDIDILYDKDKKALMRQLMTDMSYKFIAEGNNHDEFSKEPFTVVETHTSLISERHRTSGYFEDVWSNARPAGSNSFKYEMTDEYFYVFMISHLEKHFSEGGIGIRSFLDIYLFLQKKNIDRAYVTAEFEKLGLVKFAEYAEKLASMWFDGGSSDKTLLDMAEFVFQSGEKGTAKFLAIRQRSKSKSKFSYYFHLIFPSFTEMTCKYPIIKKFPPLLPIYWVKRIFEVLSDKKRIKNKVEPMADENMQKKVTSLMKKLELD